MSNILNLNPYVYLSERTDTAENEKRYDLFILVPVDQATQTDINFSQSTPAYPGALGFVFVTYATETNQNLPAAVKYRFHHVIIDKKRNGVLYNTVTVRGSGVTQTIGIDFADADTTPVNPIPTNSELLNAPYLHLHKEAEQVNGETIVRLRPSCVILFGAGKGMETEAVSMSGDNRIHTATTNSGSTLETNPDNFNINLDARFLSAVNNFFDSTVTESTGAGNPPRRKKAKVKTLNAGGGGSMGNANGNGKQDQIHTAQTIHLSKPTQTELAKTKAKPKKKKAKAKPRRRKSESV
ncbi:MAG TPA: hypothetical protein PK228_16460 [Saprospiraceae bacterium]|nr:hypothetical protein [Saprospiraceae bacterium]